MGWRRAILGAAVLAALWAALAGCVTRKMVIRSKPAGAPVWIDQRYVGQTPVEVPFTCYGTHAVQVGPRVERTEPGEEAAEKRGAFGPEEEERGPVEDVGRITHEPVRRRVRLRAPFWDWFPIDFVANVLLPWEIEHVERLEFTLPVSRAGAADSAKVAEEGRAVRARAESFRERGLHPAPEQLPPME
jgi:hypothetical protein